MNISKFTQKSLEAVQNTEKLAYEYGNQQIDQEHLLYSLSVSYTHLDVYKRQLEGYVWHQHDFHTFLVEHIMRKKIAFLWIAISGKLGIVET